MHIDYVELNNVALRNIPASFLLAVLIAWYMLSNFRFPLYEPHYWYNRAFFIWGYVTGLYIIFFLVLLTFHIIMMFSARFYEYYDPVVL